MFKDTKEGQTNYCSHENNNTSGICNKCLGGEAIYSKDNEGGFHWTEPPLTSKKRE